MLAFLIFVLILSFLVFVHELGHYLAAKRFGVKVEEFGFGIPPKLFGRKIGETEYTLNLLPFGGFVRLFGEDAETATDDVMKNPRSFMAKKAWQRAVIIVAGVFMNLIFAFIFNYVVFSINNFKSPLIPIYFDHAFTFGTEERINTVVTGIEAASPADTVGIKFGDAVVEIDDVPVYSVSDIRDALSQKAGENVRVTLVDIKTEEKDARVVNLTPKLSDDGKVYMGVSLGIVSSINYSKPVDKVFAGIFHAYNMASYTFHVLGNLVAVSVQEKSVEPVSSSLSGPVGIFGVVQQMVQISGKQAVISLLDLTAMLSLSLGIMNLLPIPALDGGRLFFVIIEMVTKKKIHPEKEALIHKVGMIILLGLIVLVSIKDFRTFF